MKWLKPTLTTCLILASVAWLIIGTNLGLRLILAFGSRFLGVDLKYSAVHGRLIDKEIHLTNLSIEHQQHTLTIEKLRLDRPMRQLLATNIQGFANFIPQAEFLQLDSAANLTELTASVDQLLHVNNLSVQANGTWQNQPLTLHGKFARSSNTWQIVQADVVLAKNSLTMHHDAQLLNWELQLPQPELFLKASKGTLYARGTLEWNETPRITAMLTATKFAVADKKIDHLHANVCMDENFKISAQAKNIRSGSRQIKSLSVQTNGHKDPFQDAWSSDNLKLTIDQYTLQGKIQYNLPNNTVDLSSDNKLYAAQLQVNLNNKKIAGKLQAQTEDLDIIMQWIPQLTRLKGKARINASISGTIKEPLVQADAHVTDITATLPALGIKIKPMELHIETSRFSRFEISGKGKMRRGSGDFSISGFVEPFTPELANDIRMVGKHVEFINNETAHLIASNDLHFVYDKNTAELAVTGDIEIESGQVNFNPKKTNTVKSKDVVFVNEQSKPKAQISLNPNIYLRIVEGVRFSGLDMDASISGKLDINRRHGTTYADGRISIKEGTYKLPGQEFKINHGRLLYPPGTLLANPVLDIKLLTANKQQDGLEIQVQGTAQKPIISESSLAGNQDKAISQALLAGSGVVSKDILRDKLKVTELGIISEDQNNIAFFENPADPKTKKRQFVVGRPLSKRIHTQYLHSMDETKKRVRLKIALSDNWEIGLEGGNRGAGADLSFVVERD